MYLFIYILYVCAKNCAGIMSFNCKLFLNFVYFIF